MALAKKCDRCGKFYEHYPKGNKSQSNAIRKVQKDDTGGTVNAFANWVIDLCPECMNSFEKWLKNEPMTFNEIRQAAGLEPIKNMGESKNAKN